MSVRRFTVLGAGAIGATVGAYMARAGVAVTLLDADAAHVQAIQERGLTIEAFDERFTVHVPVYQPAAFSEPLDIVLLAVKAHDTQPALAAVERLLTEASVIVSMQNGLCEPLIAHLVGEQRVVGALVNYSADYLEPGLIHYAGPGVFFLGELNGFATARVYEIASALRTWGPVEVTDNIYGYLWGKLGYISMIYATALTDETQSAVIDRHRELMVELASEVYEVAQQEHVRLMPFDGVDPNLFLPRTTRDWAAIHQAFDLLVEHIRLHQKPKSGVWRDLVVRKRKTEADAHVGVSLERGAKLGMAMPLNRELLRMIHELESGSRRMDLENLTHLDLVRQGQEHRRAT